MKSFDQFVKENIEQKPKYKTVLDNEQEESDGSEFEKVVDVVGDEKEEK
jgi:hypothetical protein